LLAKESLGWLGFEQCETGVGEMALVLWDDVRTGPLGTRMVNLLERYPACDQIYVTSGMEGDHGLQSHHYGLWYNGSRTAAIDIGAGGVGPGSAKMRDIARWLYDNFADYTVELIHTTPFADDDGFYVKNQVRYPGGAIYGEPTKSQHRDHIHWATSEDLMAAIEHAVGADRSPVGAGSARGLKPAQGTDMALSAAEQRELLELLREFLGRNGRGSVADSNRESFQPSQAVSPNDYWGIGYTGPLDPSLSPSVHDLRGRYISGSRAQTQIPAEQPASRSRGLAAEALRTPGLINPGPPVDRAVKIRDVTGPGLTDRFGMAATDLGVMTRTPSGRILAVFGDTFRAAWVGSPDWRGTVGLISDTKNLDEGIVWTKAAGRDPNYARQLWDYPHLPCPGGASTVLPSDVMTIGDTMYLHTTAHFPFGNVIFGEIWKSTDDGRTWTLHGPRLDTSLHGGLAQLWTWDVGDDGFVYLLSTGFRVNRDQPMILRRVPADRLHEPAAYQGWGWGQDEKGEWGWAWGREPSPVLDGGYGEICLRRIDDQWVLVAFNARDYRLDVKVFPDFDNCNLKTWATSHPIVGGLWGFESDSSVAQLYGPSIIPGSRPGSGFHILLSQWHNPGVWPYHVMQFKIPVPSIKQPRSLSPNGETSKQRGKSSPSKAASGSAGKRTSTKKAPAKRASKPKPGVKKPAPGAVAEK
jgi:hypothetical protein